MKHDLQITKRDWQLGTRGEPQACLLAVALNRQYGGRWSVAGDYAVRLNDEGRIAHKLKLSFHAMWIMYRYDHHLPCMARRTTLRGPAVNRVRSRRSTVKRNIMAGAGVSSGVLLLAGDWRIVAIGAGASAAALAGSFVVSKGLISKPAPGPAKMAAPKLSQLRAMPPAERARLIHGTLEQSRPPAQALPAPPPQPDPAPAVWPAKGGIRASELQARPGPAISPPVRERAPGRPE